MGQDAGAIVGNVSVDNIGIGTSSLNQNIAGFDNTGIGVNSLKIPQQIVPTSPSVIIVYQILQTGTETLLLVKAQVKIL